MAPGPDFTVSFTPFGAAKGTTTLFRQGGKLHLTCVLKSSFQFVSGAAMKQITTRDLIRKEINHYDNPCWSLQASPETAPYLPRVDVTMTGRACAPTGRWVQRVTVRLAIYHGIALLDKTVHVYGDHNGKEFVPFERMPLEYEKAFGGPGNVENPYGTGILPGSPLPNLISPKDPGAVAGFGPVARRLPVRSSLLGKLSVSALDQPIPEFPDDFDWSYFQAAPKDQQLPSIVGNEWIVLEGIHPTMTRLSSRLPSIRPIATIFGTNPKNPEEAQTLQLRIDMIEIDADALRVCVVARGILQIEDESTLPNVRVIGAMETEGLSYAAMLTPPGAVARPTARNADQAMTMRLETNAPKMTLPMAESPRVEIVEAPTLAMTLDTYHVDLSAPSVRRAAPPEPEWLDENDLEEVYSVDPRSNPASIRAGILQKSGE